MEKELLNKEVEVMVAFAEWGSYGGSQAKLYTGTFLECDENYYKIQINNNINNIKKYHLNKNKDEIGKICYLRKEFVIYIKEV